MGAIMKRKVAIILGLFTTSVTHARTIDKCGTYLAEGYYTEIKSNPHGKEKRRVVVLERGSNSEIRFYISNTNIKKLIPDTHLGVNFRMKLKFASSCWYLCEGEVIEVIEPLDPTQEPRQFLFPRPTPIKGSEIKCQPNSFEDKS